MVEEVPSEEEVSGMEAVRESNEMRWKAGKSQNLQEVESYFV